MTAEAAFPDKSRLLGALANARQHLLSQLGAEGFWEGRLSSSALATSVAVFALRTAGGDRDEDLVRKGLRWLAENANPDGGFGDTTDSPSNLSTTLLAWSAFSLDHEGEYAETADALEAWVARRAGSLEPERITEAVLSYYGDDRTFSAPILTVCALAGRLAEEPACWKLVPQLPFELAALPQRLFRWLRLPVVSYALPALVSIGLARHERAGKSPNPWRLVRNTVREKCLAVAARMQPENGGFLEATPLTAFVVTGLSASGHERAETVMRGVDFLKRSVREDGSWPIDTNLATWLSTVATAALAAGPETSEGLPDMRRRQLSQWLLAQQHTGRHPFTGAAPGGWAWTPLPGGVPDADDTAGALVALAQISGSKEAAVAARAGVEWLLNLANSDGGIPTFCRGWGRLPFDRSCPDITAHALGAFAAWRGRLGAALERRTDGAMSRAVTYLEGAQRQDGAWVPLWFGNQDASDHENRVYGTARVVGALLALPSPWREQAAPLAEQGLRWLASAQNSDGGWGGVPGARSSIEETALAVSALAAGTALGDSQGANLARGLSWILAKTDGGRTFKTAPIGLYFASLWYSEELYPVIFTVEALGRAADAARRVF